MRHREPAPGQVAWIRYLQCLEFILVELNLFLDNQPNNPQAIADFNRVSLELQQAKASYEQLYGPLFHFGWSASPGRWRWVDEEPWPWEIQH